MVIRYNSYLVHEITNETFQFQIKLAQNYECLLDTLFVLVPRNWSILSSSSPLSRVSINSPFLFSLLFSLAGSPDDQLCWKGKTAILSRRPSDQTTTVREGAKATCAICDALLFTPGCPLMAPETKRAGPPGFKFSSDLLKMLKNKLERTNWHVIFCKHDGWMWWSIVGK